MTGHINKASDFYEGVDKMVRGGATHLDAIVEWCSKKGLEMESVAPLIEKNPNMLSNLRAEAEALNFMAKSARLPV